MQVNDSDDEEEVVDADKLTLSRLRLALKYEQKQVRPPDSCWTALQKFMNRNSYVHLDLAGLFFTSLNRNRYVHPDLAGLFRCL